MCPNQPRLWQLGWTTTAIVVNAFNARVTGQSVCDLDVDQHTGCCGLSDPGCVQCDLGAGTCAGYDLSSLRGKVFTLPKQDCTGDICYQHRVALFGSLPESDIPTGCKSNLQPGDGALHPAAVRFNPDQPADCLVLGSIGPCLPSQMHNHSPCGMTGMTKGDGVGLTYHYEWGCSYTFTLLLTPGNTDAPPAGTYESAGCDYHTVWPGLDLYRRDTLSTGWQVVLWLLLGSAVYFVGGVAYGYVKGQRGFDGHPHSRFWRQLPGLFKDGIVWSNKQASRQPVARNANSEIVDGVTVFSGESTKLMANGGSVTYGALQQDNDDNSL